MREICTLFKCLTPLIISAQSEHSRRSLAAVREELEVARQEAAQALDCLCAERESRAQDALQLKDAVPLSKHKEALSAVSEQLAQTLQELQEEKRLRGQAEERAAGLEARLQAKEDGVSKEEHENMKVCSGPSQDLFHLNIYFPLYYFFGFSSAFFSPESRQ